MHFAPRRVSVFWCHGGLFVSGSWGGNPEESAFEDGGGCELRDNRFTSHLV
jgi:hypothetical protein